MRTTRFFHESSIAYARPLSRPLSRPLLRLFVAVLVFIVLAVPARPAAAQLNLCNWVGSDKGNNWSISDNWSCGNVPGPDADVMISDMGIVPYLDIPGSIRTLMINGRLNFGNELSVSAGWTAMDGAVLGGAGTLKGSGTVQAPGTVMASITFDGNITINPLATLKSMEAPWGTITCLGDVLNDGTIGSDDPWGTFVMKGLTFFNTGKVQIPFVRFEAGGGQYQYVMGAGEWSNLTDFSIADNTKLKPTSTMTFKTHQFTVGDTTLLDLSGAEILFDGTGGSVVVNNSGSILGDYTVNTRGTVQIGGPNGSTFSVPLHVRTGTTVGWGTFNRTITVDSGATLSVNQAPAGELIANANVTNNGTISGLEPGSLFTMLGETFTNSGAVTVGEFAFQKTDGEQRLSGSGTWGKTVHLDIDEDVNVALQNSITMNVAALNVWGAYNYPTRANLDVGSNTLTLTGPLTFQVGSDGRVTGSGAVHTRGMVTMRTVGAAIFAPTLQVQSVSSVPADSTTTLYGRFDGPVEVREDAVLALAEDSQVFLNNNLTVGGALEAAESSLLTISGENIKVDGVLRSHSLTTLQSAKQQTIDGGSSGQMDAYQLVVDTPLGVNLKIPLTVRNLLNLGGYTGGDIIATGEGAVTLTSQAACIGIGDVWGKTIRPGPLSWDQAYTFGNENNQITLTAWPGEAELPSSLTVELTKGTPTGLQGAIRWYRVTAEGGALFGATLRLRYRDSEVVPAAKEETLRLWRKQTSGSAWATVADAAQDLGSHWFQVEDLTSFSDWAIAAFQVYLPMLRK